MFAGIRAGTTSADVGTDVTADLSVTPTPGSGEYVTWTYTLNVAAGDALIGQPIGFEMGVVNEGLNRNMAFDNLQIVFAPVAVDTDGDGILDHLDIDSDNDGITDNIEAQSTAGFTAPSGLGGTPEFRDIDRDGLDDVFDAVDDLSLIHI